MSPAPVDVLICNPGTHPEMTYLAAASVNNFRTVYATSSSLTHDMVLTKALSASSLIAPSISANGLRRVLPKAIGRSDIAYAGTAAEVLYQVSKRMAPQYADRLLHYRNRSYGRRIRSLVKKCRPRLIVGQYTASLDAFQSTTSDTLKILNYPIVHHRWLLDNMKKEADKNPKWATTLQGHNFSDNLLATLDEEISLADFLLVPSSFAGSSQSGV